MDKRKMPWNYRCCLFVLDLATVFSTMVVYTGSSTYVKISRDYSQQNQRIYYVLPIYFPSSITSYIKFRIINSLPNQNHVIGKW